MVLLSTCIIRALFISRYDSSKLILLIAVCYVLHVTLCYHAVVAHELLSKDITVVEREAPSDVASRSDDKSIPNMSVKDGDAGNNNRNADDNANVKKRRPNIMFILADDIGHGNLGFMTAIGDTSYKDRYPSYLATNVSSTITKLAMVEGRVLTRHYVAHACTPSRSSFQSGRLPIHVTMKLQSPCQAMSGVPEKMTGIGEIMSKAGYITSMIGKWDCGMTTLNQIPQGKGYNDSLIIFSHAVWPNSQEYINDKKKLRVPIFKEVPKCPVPGQNNCFIDFWENDRPAKTLQGTDHIEEIFVKRIIDTLETYARNGNQNPFFIVYTPRLAHYPLDVPVRYQNKVREFVHQNVKFASQAADLKISPHRLVYHALILYLDELIHRIVDTLKSTKLWDNTLLVFSSDNGGDISQPIDCFQRAVNDTVCPQGGSGSNNFPLRGGKGSYFEGGIRVPAFISGGYVPSDKRGQPINRIIHIADWYATFAHAAGVDDIREKKSDIVPDVDSINLWKALDLPDLDNDSPGANIKVRTKALLSDKVLISGNYKIMFGYQRKSGYTEAFFPFKRTYLPGQSPSAKWLNCGTYGCVFDVVKDPRETKDIAKLYPDLTARLRSDFKVQFDTIWWRPYNPKDPRCFRTATRDYGGFLGPWIL